ncbi:MAG: Fic family protein [Verrucomicrobiales bacterium]|nr:Fic family protein [Akkermansiaceae bacterium]
MNLDDYKAGSFKEQYEYKSFTPSPVNHAWSWSDPRIDTLLSEANRRLGELNGLSLIVPDLDRFIRMHVVKEAQTSSRIEGTQTGMDEAVQDDPEEIAPEKRDDWQEVRNYIVAMNQAIRDLKELPLSNRLLCQTHATLLSGARGERKTPGEFRRSQNWIGGSSLKDAVFIPPHHDDLPLLLTDLEAFWHNESIHVPHLIRIAISHYQFETIHPFLDGNGRIGRLLITLYLVDKELLQHPCLYLSSHLEKNRTSYYDALSHVRTTNDLGHWLRFFLVAVIETAKQAIETFRAIFELRNRTSDLLASYGRAAPNATRIVDFLYQKPVTSSQELQSRLSLSRATCDRLITQLVQDCILKEITGRQRNRHFVFSEYYQLFLK